MSLEARSKKNTIIENAVSTVASYLNILLAVPSPNSSPKPTNKPLTPAPPNATNSTPWRTNMPASNKSLTARKNSSNSSPTPTSSSRAITTTKANGENAAQDLSSVLAPPELDQASLDDLNHLLTNAKTHNATPHEIARIRDYLIRFPQLAKELGDLSGFSLRSITAHAAGDPITREAIQASAQEFKRQLARPGDTTLEQFAIDQCVNAHVLHYTIELRYINVHNSGATSARSLYWEQRLNSSQKRYLRALDNLARLRRFAIPPIQINIGETQTNISAASPSASSPDPQILDTDP